MDPLDELTLDDESDTPLASDGIPADDPPAEPLDLIGDAEGTISPPPPAPAHDPNTIRSIYERESYAWALDVFFVYEHLGTTAKAAKATKEFTAARRALLQHSKDDMNNFMGQLLPKAMQLLEKANEKNGDLDTVVAEEKKEINKLRQTLRAAIEEAKGVTP
jgi:hypothetical protein